MDWKGLVSRILRQDYVTYVLVSYDGFTVPGVLVMVVLKNLIVFKSTFQIDSRMI